MYGFKENIFYHNGIECQLIAQPAERVSSLFAGINKEKNDMATINENDLPALLLENTTLRLVKPKVVSGT